MLCRAYLLLWYRVDYFQALGLAPPETWDQLLSMANDSAMWLPLTSSPSPSQPAGNASVAQSGSNTNSTGAAMPPSSRRHVLAGGNSTANSSGSNSSTTPSTSHQVRGLCLDLAPSCAGSHVMAAIFASLAAYAGNSQVRAGFRYWCINECMMSGR
jgi:hypothetical protein